LVEPQHGSVELEVRCECECLLSAEVRAGCVLERDRPQCPLVEHGAVSGERRLDGGAPARGVRLAGALAFRGAESRGSGPPRAVQLLARFERLRFTAAHGERSQLTADRIAPVERPEFPGGAADLLAALAECALDVFADPGDPEVALAGRL